MNDISTLSSDTLRAYAVTPLGKQGYCRHCLTDPSELSGRGCQFTDPPGPARLVPDREGESEVVLMSAPWDKPDREKWPKPAKWQVLLAAASLLVAIISLAVQFAQKLLSFRT